MAQDRGWMLCFLAANLSVADRLARRREGWSDFSVRARRSIAVSPRGPGFLAIPTTQHCVCIKINQVCKLQDMNTRNRGGRRILPSTFLSRSSVLYSVISISSSCSLGILLLLVTMLQPPELLRCQVSVSPYLH